MTKHAPWATPAALVRLRVLWERGASSADIGREVHASRNAVLSMAHRMGLPARASPLHPPKPNGKAQPIRRTTGSTLPPLQSEQGEPP